MKKSAKEILIQSISDINPNNKSGIYSTNLYWSKKPYNIADEIITKFSKKGDVVFDPFMGSGVTVIQAYVNSRNAIGVDINEIPHFMVNSIIESKEIDLSKIKYELEQIDNLQSYYKYDTDERIIVKIEYDLEPTKAIKKIFTRKKNSKKEDKVEFNGDFAKLLITDYKLNNLNDFKLVENSRIAVKKGMKLSDLFTNRNLKVLDEIYGIIREIGDKTLKQTLMYNLISVVHMARKQDVKMSSQWPLWIPKKNCLERNVIDLFFKRLYKLVSELNKFNKTKKSNSSYSLIRKPIQYVTELEVPSKSVDLVLTDPPYMAQVPYSEYMQLYAVFFENSINFKDEIVISNAPSRKKNEDVYFQLLKEAFDNTSRMMKDKAHMFMYFHDINLKYWQKIMYIMDGVGLSFSGIVHIKKNSYTLKKILSPKKTLNGDAIWIFQKNNRLRYSSNLNINEQEKAICKFVSKLIEDNGPLSTTEIYDYGTMEFVINEGMLDEISKKHNDLTTILEKELKWNVEIQKWEKRTNSV